jgi:hypothetical protein
MHDVPALEYRTNVDGQRLYPAVVLANASRMRGPIGTPQMAGNFSRRAILSSSLGRACSGSDRVMGPRFREDDGGRLRVICWSRPRSSAGHPRDDGLSVAGTGILRRRAGISWVIWRPSRDAVQGVRRSHSELWRRRATPQRARYGQQNCPTYSCAAPKPSQSAGK